MSYCLNPTCEKPQNPTKVKLCQTCRSKLLLKNRYRALQPIGQGGFGRTFLAIDEDKPSKPRCVIKQFLPASLSSNNPQKAAELFEQEAVRLDELGKHSQIPQLLAYATQNNRQYLVQEFIDGYNLAQVIQTEGTFNETQICNLLNSLLPLLHFIHSYNVIHRDIKPENIIRRQNGQLVIVDFGAAKFATGTALLKTGTSIGSPEYIAPEQARGKTVFASDLYSLGVTCIYLLTQVSPFDLFDPGEDTWIWRQYLVNNPVSHELGHIIDKMIENATNRRYQSAAEVLKDLNPQAAINLANPQVIAKTQAIPKQLTPTVITTNSKPQTHNWKCIHTLTGHTNLVYSVAFSPDEDILASSSDDNSIKLWQVKDGQEIRTLTGHTNSVYSIAFNPDGKIIASSSHDKTLKLWQVKDGQEIRTLRGHTNSVYGVAFSPDGETIASSSWDKNIKIWRVKDGEEISTIKGHNNLVYAVAFGLNGEILASGSWDRTIKIWRVKDAKLLVNITSHLDCVRCLAFSPNGEFLASGSHDNTIKIWWTKNWQEVLTIAGHSWYVDSVAFSPDGEFLASSSNQTIKIWRVKDGKEICNLTGHANSVYSVAFSPDGETIASGSSDKTIKIWRCDRGMD